MAAQPVGDRRPSGRGPSWEKRLVVVLVVAVGLVIAYLLAAAVVPRWWANRVGSVVDSSLTVGALYGLFIGFVFTMLPLLVAWMAVRFRRPSRTWKGWLGWILLALVLAAPNLMTLGIVLGRNDAARAGEFTLSTAGNGFKLWSLIGAILAVLAFLGVQYLVRTRGWFRDQNRRLRDEAVERTRTE